MTSESISLIKYRQSSNQRAHFAIHVTQTDPNPTTDSDPSTPEPSTLIHVIGSPMFGFKLEIKHGYDLASDPRRYTIVRLGTAAVPESAVARIERLAGSVEPPGVSRDVMGPVDGVHNRRCQEWAVDFVQLLVQQKILSPDALDTIQSERDAPGHGVGLQQPISRTGPLDLNRAFYA